MRALVASQVFMINGLFSKLKSKSHRAADSEGLTGWHLALVHLTNQCYDISLFWYVQFKFSSRNPILFFVGLAFPYMCAVTAFSDSYDKCLARFMHFFIRNVCDFLALLFLQPPIELRVQGFQARLNPKTHFKLTLTFEYFAMRRQCVVN